jgi:hypothetical protein
LGKRGELVGPEEDPGRSIECERVHDAVF